MPTSTPKIDKKPVAEAGAAPAQDVPQSVLLFELEYMVNDSRKALYNAIQAALAEQKSAMNTVLFCRHCLAAGPGYFMPGLLEAVGSKKDPGKTTEDVLARWTEALLAAKGPRSGLLKLIKAAQERNIGLAVITQLTEDKAAELLAKLGLDQFGIQVCSFTETDRPFPRADVWLKITRSLSKMPRRCLALASSMAACKSALSADLQCVAAPDDYTAFQDFSGVKQVAESLDDLDCKEVLESICSPALKPVAKAG
jgi:beta-phosphoglucomutase-like phosphatase (HAD superfamily)